MAELIVNQIHSSLIKKRKTVAVAESLTGGFLSDLLTALPGSSKYFMLGVVAYSNEAKQDILKIPLKLISKKGAVSKKVAAAMAKSIRKISKVDFGIGITGIAGPSGGSNKKPVGTVFIAVNTEGKKICKKFNFSGSRSNIRKQSALQTLELLKNLIIAGT